MTKMFLFKIITFYKLIFPIFFFVLLTYFCIRLFSYFTLYLNIIYKYLITLHCSKWCSVSWSIGTASNLFNFSSTCRSQAFISSTFGSSFYEKENKICISRKSINKYIIRKYLPLNLYRVAISFLYLLISRLHPTFFP